MYSIFPSMKTANPITDQYGRGTLGIHVWEIPAHQINSTFNVSLLLPVQHC
jgi:hypothetical protein